VRPETDTVVTIGLDVAEWPGRRAGQHLDVRLTDEDGEVSPYLTEELRAGDQLEIRGPIGDWFAWRTSDGGPLLLMAWRHCSADSPDGCRRTRT
jgi:ferredoxin-NADP reductase